MAESIYVPTIGLITRRQIITANTHRSTSPNTPKLETKILRNQNWSKSPFLQRLKPYYNIKEHSKTTIFKRRSPTKMQANNNSFRTNSTTHNRPKLPGISANYSLMRRYVLQNSHLLCQKDVNTLLKRRI